MRLSLEFMCVLIYLVLLSFLVFICVCVFFLINYNNTKKFKISCYKQHKEEIIIIIINIYIKKRNDYDDFDFDLTQKISTIYRNNNNNGSSNKEFMTDCMPACLPLRSSIINHN